MFKLSLKREKFRVKLQKHIFKPTINMYDKFTLVIKDFKIVKTLKSKIGVHYKVVAKLSNRIKNSALVKVNIDVKAKLYSTVKVFKNILGQNTKIRLTSNIRNKVATTIIIKSNIEAKESIKTKSNTSMYAELKIKARAWLVRLRRLEEIENMTLEEIGDMTLEEISYIKL